LNIQNDPEGFFFLFSQKKKIFFQNLSLGIFNIVGLITLHLNDKQAPQPLPENIAVRNLNLFS